MVARPCCLTTRTVGTLALRIGSAMLPFDQEIAPEKIQDPITVLSIND
jgi:hypothetical protein